MKQFFIFLCFASSACSKSESPVSDYQLPYSEYQIGEYLQVDVSGSLISVNRSDDQSGLVRLNPSKNQLTVLDPTAKEARDIFVSDHFIAYRVDQEVRLWNQKPLTFLTPVSRLRGFQWLNTFGRVTFETKDKEPHWATFREDGKIIADGNLPGSVRASLINGDQELVVFQNADGLFLGRFGNESEGLLEQWSIEAGRGGAYASIRMIEGTLSVAYFDDDAGVLKIATKAKDKNSFSVSLVDGTPGQTYRGMDIAIFNDRGHPGLVYLDGWALKLRWARLSNDKWLAEELPIKGAVGFYNQIIEEKSDSIMIGSHNFRSHIQNFKQSFEDLSIFRLRLSPI